MDGYMYTLTSDAIDRNMDICMQGHDHFISLLSFSFLIICSFNFSFS